MCYNAEFKINKYIGLRKPEVLTRRKCRIRRAEGDLSPNPHPTHPPSTPIPPQLHRLQVERIHVAIDMIVEALFKVSPPANSKKPSIYTSNVCSACRQFVHTMWTHTRAHTHTHTHTHTLCVHTAVTSRTCFRE